MMHFLPAKFPIEKRFGCCSFERISTSNEKSALGGFISRPLDRASWIAFGIREFSVGSVFGSSIFLARFLSFKAPFVNLFY